MDMQNSFAGDEAKLRAENDDCVLSTSVDEIPSNGDFHASSKESTAVNTSDRKLRSGVCRHNGVVGRTAHMPLLNGQAEAGETVPSKRVGRLKNFVSNGHREVSRTVDSESRNQGICTGTYFILDTRKESFNLKLALPFFASNLLMCLLVAVDVKENLLLVKILFCPIYLVPNILAISLTFSYPFHDILHYARTFYATQQFVSRKI